MFGHIAVDGVLVAGAVVDGLAVLAVRLAPPGAVVDEAACAITKLPTPVPASRPTESSAVAAILRMPVRRRAGSSGGGGGGMNWSSMVVYLLGGLTFDVVQRRAGPSERRGRALGDCSEL